MMEFTRYGTVASFLRAFFSYGVSSFGSFQTTFHSFAFGFASGLVGVVVTYLLCIPINMLLHHLTGIGNLSAQLPVITAVILVAISVVLTMFSGIIPSKSAARKDPVVALRTE